MIWYIIIFFAMISLAVIYSASSALAYRGDTVPIRFMFGQMAYYILSFGILYLCYRIPLKIYSGISYIAMAASVILLVIPLIDGDSENSRSFALLGVTVQPSEIAKISVVLYLARILETHKFDTFRKFLLWIVAPLGILLVLCLVGSVSATIIVGFISAVILLTSGINKKYLAWCIPIALGAVLSVLVIHYTTGMFPRIKTAVARIERKFDKTPDEQLSEQELKEKKDKEFQADQAREAIQLGGIIGRGPGNSLKRDILPNAYDDYIFAIILEEYGLIGGAAVIFLYICFFYRCIIIAKACTREFSTTVVLGLSFLVITQAFLHIFVNIGILPVTGQTLPMISRGGSSLVIMSTSFGLILSVNRTIVIKEEKRRAQEAEELKKLENTI